MNDWLSWNGKKCTEYGIHVLEQPPITIPAERATFTNVPGRPGSLTTLEGDDVYDDLILTAQCIISNPNNIHTIASYPKGSGKVTFSNRPGGFYFARIVNQIPFEKILRGNPHRSFAVNFRCQPFWYQENVPEITVTTSGTFINNPGSVYSEPVITVYGSGEITLMVGMVIVELDGITDSITLDTPLMEAYKQYAALTDIFLGDSVRVMARRIGVEISMRMTQYTYDCLTRKYTSVTLGTAADTLEGSMISSRQLPSGVISGSKLVINSVGAGQLQSGSVGSLQVKMAAIQTAHIQDAAITKAKIAEATIGELNATAITAIFAKIQELAAKNITTDELYAALATIAVAQITAANIEKANINWADIGELSAQIATIAQAQITTANINSASIDWASIANLNAEIAKIAKAQITAANIESAAIDWAAIKDLNAAVAKIALAQLTTANINSAEIDWASITQLQADIATLVNASIKTADIDWARIKDMTAGTAIIEKGVNGKLYVADLAVTEANMASLTVGELIVKGADGCFYALSIAEDGTVTTEKKSVGDADIGDNSISGGKLIEKTITARELNVASIFADEALVGAITAANIDVSSLFAAEAFIAQLNAVDISGNESLRLVVDTAKDEALDATGEAVAQIALTAEQIRSEVKRDYATSDQMSQVTETLSTLAEQSENNFTWTVTKVNEIIEDAAASDNLTREQLNLIHTYMRFGEDGLTIGKAGNPLTFRVINDRLAFYMNDTEVAYLSDNKLYVTQAEILARLQIGKFAYEPQSNGNLSVIYTG